MSRRLAEQADRLDAGNYPVRFTYRTLYSDMDPNRHLNNGAFGRLFEEGRSDLHHRVIGMSAGPAAANGLILLLATITMEFLREGRYPGSVEVASAVLRVGSSSYVLAQAAFQDQACIALADCVMVKASPAARSRSPGPSATCWRAWPSAARQRAPWDPSTVLDDDAVTDAARRLLAAERSREPIRQLSLQYPDMTIEDAYRVQRALVALKLAEGRTIKARKIGLTSRAMQQAVSISEPDYGVILDDMFFDDGGTVPAERFIRPSVEVELAFVLDQPLKGPGVTALDVLDATRWVTPALEILDARVQMSDPQTGHLRTIVDTISDNAADAGIVVGGRAVRPDACDLRRVSALLYVNEAIEETGVAAGVLGHPANGVAWLANRLAPYEEFLPAGQVILAGSFTRPVFVRAGDVVHADFGELGAVTCRFR